MACNCKAKKDFDAIAKFSEGSKVRNVNEKLTLGLAFSQLINGILKIIVGILLFFLFIVVSIPILIYAGVCMIFGKQAKIKLIRPFNKVVNGK